MDQPPRIPALNFQRSNTGKQSHNLKYHAQPQPVISPQETGTTRSRSSHDSSDRSSSSSSDDSTTAYHNHNRSHNSIHGQPEQTGTTHANMNTNTDTTTSAARLHAELSLPYQPQPEPPRFVPSRPAPQPPVPPQVPSSTYSPTPTPTPTTFHPLQSRPHPSLRTKITNFLTTQPPWFYWTLFIFLIGSTIYLTVWVIVFLVGVGERQGQGPA
ncbi:hypothetical protein OHC33_003085 [Knufia fluminis]|uniref:Uncharacterized protein n=1 Tax=Knufia fluminis TaxID=191047 RepID=A0AAN8IPW4_9EURO|nr:hypothetical protein OHC33_003085 [Knufia fluminis]